ncbi:MAG TPA: right-handed parallel beta-helix repeat-containing protein [Baekduia sp.]|nr:right-handed parallel beta-helix repeat-containing protein [Baekduia sp.]
MRRALGALGAALLLALLAQAPPAMAATFTVTTTADTGPGSLRQAITDANAGPGNSIAFAIPGPGPHTITPASALPSITEDDTTLDGCTQPGAACSSLPLTLTVRLSGQGVQLAADNATIRGLSVTGATFAAISFQRWAQSGAFHVPMGTVIEHNYLGLAPDGSSAGNARALDAYGGTRTGGTVGWDGTVIRNNVIGANSAAALNWPGYPFSAGVPVKNVVITGNLIGVDPTGTQPRPNAGDAILFDVSGNLQITNNTIANSGGAAIRHRGRNQAVPGSDPLVDPGTLIQGNTLTNNTGGGIVLGPKTQGADPYRGPVNVFGNTITGNGIAGVTITSAAETLRPNLLVGGTAAGQANVITANNGPGVAVGPNTSDTSVAVTIRGNSIYGNTGPKIDLANDGDTANGPAGTLRTGPNTLTNFPSITSIAHGSIIIIGTYAGAASASYTLDFYASPTADGAQTWIGATNVTTDAGGDATFNARFASDVPEGWFIGATATDANGSTSEFADGVIVPPVPPTPPATVVVNTSETSKARLSLTSSANRTVLRAGGNATFAFTLRNPSVRSLRNVRVCDRLPAGLVYVGSSPRARLANGAYCWTISQLRSGAARSFRLRVRALPGANGRKVNRVTVTSPDARTARVGRSIRVLGETAVGGGVTG